MKTITLFVGTFLTISSGAMALLIRSAPPYPMQGLALLLMALCGFVGLALCHAAMVLGEGR